MIVGCCIDGGLFDAILFTLLGGPAAVAYVKRRWFGGCPAPQGD